MIFDLQQRLLKLDSLIKKKGTGTPTELAKKLGFTVEAWYKFKVRLVTKLNIPIEYDRYRRTYYYTEPGRIKFEFTKESAENGS